jgi:hypothetical protein
MNNQKYLNNYFGGVDQMMTAADYAELKAELQIFKEHNLELSPSEFRTKIRDEYSDLINATRMKSYQVKLESINKKLHFFVIVIVVGLIGSLLALIAVINGK